MDRRTLGKSGIEISRLCYGTLTLSYTQAGLSPEEGGELIAYAAKQGVNFVDTAQLYKTYAHIKYALRHTSERLVISTKSYAYDTKSAQESVEQARREMDADVIDIFMLHEQENVLTMCGHKQALDYYLKMKEKGIIRAVGISTHAIEPVQAVAQALGFRPADEDGHGHGTEHGHGHGIEHGQENGQGHEHGFANQFIDRWHEFDPGRYREIDMIHPILNMTGIGLLDGTAAQMKRAVEDAHSVGAGILGMKMLGGGNLFNEFDQAVEYALSIDAADAYAVGMQSRDEIDMNVTLFENRKVKDELLDKTKARKRTLKIEDWCTGCGECVKQCKSDALRIENGKACVNPADCVLCSYCARACRDFAIKVI
ncbi:MAG: aldo/keto reductase [Saccharofermentanales bacterium]